jgi:hypothetical protein
MSILDNNSQTPADKAIRIANNIKGTTRQTFQMMTNAFNAGSKNFWNNPHSTPTQIAEALGTDAREVFELHYALGQLINSIKPESIQEGWDVIGQFTMNEDGTVTIIEPENTNQ